jgi:hypothetical protein
MQNVRLPQAFARFARKDKATPINNLYRIHQGQGIWIADVFPIQFAVRDGLGYPQSNPSCGLSRFFQSPHHLSVE